MNISLHCILSTVQTEQAMGHHGPVGLGHSGSRVILNIIPVGQLVVPQVFFYTFGARLNDCNAIELSYKCL